MKRIFKVFGILALILATGCGEAGKMNANADTAGGMFSAAPSTEVGTPGLMYGTTHGGYEVIGYDGPEGDVIIPDEYEGYPVVAIADGAFRDAQIDSVTLGVNIKTIEDHAFSRCKYLEKVRLNAGLEEIDYNAFSDCDALRSVILPRDCSLKEIDTCAFFRCSSLETFEVPLSCTYLGTSVFKGCTGLREVTFPENWEGCIDGSCFEGCTALSSIEIPSLTALGMGAFAGWNKTQSIRIGCSEEQVKFCYSGYLYEQSFLTNNGRSLYDVWFADCEAAYTFGG